jgi:hypothetical protein
MSESEPLSGRGFRLESFDSEPAWACAGTILSRLRVGDRTDWAWARLEPPLRVGPHRWLRDSIDVDVFAIAPRHLHATWTDGPWPLHVYVCRPIDPAATQAEVLGASDLAIEFWATLTLVGKGPDAPAA